MADQLPAFIPPSGDTTTQNSPLGVPNGYKPPLQFGPTGTGSQFTQHWGSQTLFGTDPHAGLYMPGDEINVPMANVENVPTIKKRLFEAGLLNSKTLGNLGVWDQNAASAYRKVLDFANIYGMNANDAMDYFV